MVAPADLRQALLDEANLDGYEPIHVLSEVTSTQQTAWELPFDLCWPGKGVVLALTQTGGRGREDHSWFSPEGGLYLSLVRIPVEPPQLCPTVALLAGLAVAEAILLATGIRVDLKWPNDVLIHGRKLAGVLCETRRHRMVVGVGINLARPAREIPRFPDFPYTCIEAELGTNPGLGKIAGAFLSMFHRLELPFVQTGVFPLDRYLEFFPFRGKTVTMETRCGPATGTITGVTPTGELALVLADGRPYCVRSGEVRHVRERE